MREQSLMERDGPSEMSEHIESPTPEVQDPELDFWADARATCSSLTTGDQRGTTEVCFSAVFGVWFTLLVSSYQARPVVSEDGREVNGYHAGYHEGDGIAQFGDSMRNDLENWKGCMI